MTPWEALDPGSTARGWLEKRLREIARVRSDSPVDEQELQHLVHVILHSSLLLERVYTSERLSAILGGDVERALPGSMLAQLQQGGEEPLPRLRRLPEEVRAVGNQCLFDVGITGLTEFRGLPLQELGMRAYRLAAEILARLADDSRLKKYFERNLLWPLPIGEEVTFLRQCASRFDLHAELLRSLSFIDPLPSDASHVEKEGKAVFAPFSSRAFPPQTDVAISGDPVPPAFEEILTPPAPARSREETISAYERLLLFSSLDLESLRAELSRLVVGQPEAVDTICQELALFAAGTHDPDRPACYFFVGPTGVGKNYLVETLSRILSKVWGVEVPYLQIEGPNYTDASDINELRGSTRGFIRSDEEGLLAEFHQRSSAAPFSVLLVDEVEKAHPHLRKFFLSLMDRGTLTDNRGRTLSFAGCLLVFTSNAGYSESAQAGAPIGYRGEEQRERFERADAESGLRQTLSPEFMNRLKIVRFRHLGPESINRIFDLEFGKVSARFREMHGLEVLVTPAARSALISRGYSYQFGARHLTSVVDRYCNVEVARKLLRDEQPHRRIHSELLTWLREIRSGERAFNVAEVRGRVMDETRARLPYRRIEVDVEGEEFIYRGLR